MQVDKSFYGLEVEFLLLEMNLVAAADKDLKLRAGYLANDLFRDMQRRAEVVIAANRQGRLPDRAQPREVVVTHDHVSALKGDFPIELAARGSIDPGRDTFRVLAGI